MFCKGKRLNFNNIHLKYKNIKNNYVCAHAHSRDFFGENIKIYL